MSAISLSRPLTNRVILGNTFERCLLCWLVYSKEFDFQSIRRPNQKISSAGDPLHPSRVLRRAFGTCWDGPQGTVKEESHIRVSIQMRVLQMRVSNLAALGNWTIETVLQFSRIALGSSRHWDREKILDKQTFSDTRIIIVFKCERFQVVGTRNIHRPGYCLGAEYSEGVSQVKEIFLYSIWVRNVYKRRPIVYSWSSKQISLQLSKYLHFGTN
jgi:hypothetical protein